MLLAQLHGSMSRTDACSIPATWSASRCLSMADVTGWISAARCLTWRNLCWCEVIMGFETLIGIAAAVIAAIAGAFGLGHGVFLKPTTIFHLRGRKVVCLCRLVN